MQISVATKRAHELKGDMLSVALLAPAPSDTGKKRKTSKKKRASKKSSGKALSLIHI